MGTVAYMSPEQAQGMDVDSRSDIWSLGCVLYEMVSGQRPFLGQYDQALLYEIVHEETAPLTSVRAGVPMELEFIVGECLAKDRDDRTGTAQEVARKLRTLAEKLKSGRSTILHTAQMTGAVPATMTGAHTLNPAGTLPPDAVLMKRSSQRALPRPWPPSLRLAAMAGAGLSLPFSAVSAPSPASCCGASRSMRRAWWEGSRSPRTASTSLKRHWSADEEVSGAESLATGTSRGLCRGPGGIECALGRAGLFWSADSSSLGFSVGPNDYELKRVSINGGSPLKLCELPTKNPVEFFRGGTWSPDGERIVFASGGRLYEVAARGGQPQLLFDPGDDPLPYSSYPRFLPPGQGPTALAYTTGIDDWGEHNLSVLNLENGQRRDLGPGRQPVFAASGYSPRVA